MSQCHEGRTKLLLLSLFLSLFSLTETATSES